MKFKGFWFGEMRFVALVIWWWWWRISFFSRAQLLINSETEIPLRLSGVGFFILRKAAWIISWPWYIKGGAQKKRPLKKLFFGVSKKASSLLAFFAWFTNRARSFYVLHVAKNSEAKQKIGRLSLLHHGEHSSESCGGLLLAWLFSW